ncbi:amino acid adenylation domain-containing protein [Kitasatospora sp. MAA4]|uniref:amino acid adenylation domain-containing protein n=1 Tax=Kitasatospora sp. MAA4 TaxID=3035093 RepID=UPI0024735007|nr:amino acid adenylation domain-containing protein [Kitasatospora sp. MAA4]MDH6131463.1 amino acid adenylation domain-containing protein [Kitasatospora sp. MAA4]
MTHTEQDAGRTVIAPASFAQRRLWFLDHFTNGNSAYNLVSALHLQGPLDTGALHRSLQRITDRHETLRTTFLVEDGEPYQRIAPAHALALPVTDLTAVPAPERIARATALVEADTLREFDLTRGPLIRTSLLRLDAEEHVLSVVCHHSICDGWSMGRFHLELSALYTAELTGIDAQLDPLPIQFGQYAELERKELLSLRAQESLTRLRERLAGAPAVLELPTSFPRPAVQGYAGATFDLALEPELWQATARTARQHRVTPFMTLLSAFAVLLSRLCGTQDLVIGSPSAGRTGTAVEPLIGMFVNTLPLRQDLSGDPDFAELLLRTRRGTLAAFGDQGVPLEQLVTALELDRTASHDPLFQTMFALQQPASVPQLDGLSAQILPVRPPTTFTDLWLEIRPSGDGAVATFRYRTELFDAPTVQRIAQQYRNLLRAAVDAPQTKVSALSLLGREEAEEILHRWSRTDEPHPWDGPVHQLIEHQAARTPEATAVVFESTRLSYAQLSARTRRIARRLAEQGASPRSVVALCLPRGVELLPSILAVLSGGGAYLPLSPEDPPGRLARLVQLSGATHVLTTAELSGAFAQAGVPVLAVDADASPEAAEAAEAAVPVEVAPDDLAYVIYTSGSTGEPKAVGVPHRGLANRIHCLQDSQHLTPEDRVLQKTPYTFDVSVQELLWPLTVGATLVVAEPGGHRDPAYLVDLIEREAITTVHFVPPMLEVFLEEPDLHRCASLTRVMCSGQALPAQLRDRCLDRLPVRLSNFYGPTEASIEVTEWECPPRTPGSDGPRDARVPIGRPIAGVEVYVLDDLLRPVPVGIPGELFLGGVALARGYLGRPELTADRFVPHPYSRTPGARLYRTGDLVRWRADATIDFLGRNDHQLKIRGFRIEPGEIENALRSHPGVQDALVTTTLATTPGSEPALTAYLVRIGTAGQDGPDEEAFTAALREWLRDRLPRYMVPGQLVVLPRFPLNPSGKVDRAALPLPRQARPEQLVGPRDELERTLSDIWSQVLGREQTGVAEDFFEIGGDSLKSIQVVHRAREAGLTLSVSQLFHHPTVEELAAQLRQKAAQ